MQSRENTISILKALNQKYGEVETFLDHKTPFQLLIAVILSAQTTDAMVNKTTPALFEKYPDAKSLKNAEVDEVEYLIRRVNYYHTKAKNLINTARTIDEEFDNKIPDNISDLIKLHGVGRKVANVILSEIYKTNEGFVVDTHIKRVAKRIGWTKSENPVVIEKDIMNALPQNSWAITPKQLILIGRNYCFPKNPDCENCPLAKWCEKNIEVKNKILKKSIRN